MRFKRSCSSASDITYSYPFLRSVVRRLSHSCAWLNRRINMAFGGYISGSSCLWLKGKRRFVGWTPTKTCHCLLMVHQGTAPIIDFASYHITSVTCLNSLADKQIHVWVKTLPPFFGGGKLLRNYVIAPCSQKHVVVIQCTEHCVFVSTRHIFYWHCDHSCVIWHFNNFCSDRPNNSTVIVTRDCRYCWLLDWLYGLDPVDWLKTYTVSKIRFCVVQKQNRVNGFIYPSIAVSCEL